MDNDGTQTPFFKGGDEEVVLVADDAAKAATPEEGDGTPKEGEAAEEVAEHPLTTAKPTKEPTEQETVPLKRLSKEVAKRHAAETKVSDLEKSLAEVTGKLKVHDDLKSRASKRYSRFDNPLAQMESDANYMDALETASQQDSDLAESLKTVAQFLGKEPAVSDQAAAKTETTETAPATDPRIEAIVERDARRTAEDALRNLEVKPHMVEILSDYAIGAMDPAELDAEKVVAFAKEFIAERGMSPEEVLIKAPAAKEGEGDKKGAKPPTGNSTSATPARGQDGKFVPKGDAGNAEPKAPATRDEWMANRDSRLSDFFGK